MMMDRTPDWMAEAMCRGMDPELFFPSRGDNTTTDAARTVCNQCPVRQECKELALANTEKFGIWGGTSERERRRLRAGRPRTPKPPTHGTNTGYCRGCRCPQCTEAHRLYQSVAS